jgi:DNA-binding transcriptional LysR family regulator
MADLDTRELEYFVAVAEELHFGRAADRLLVAQPAVSKTIRRLEARLGVLLFVRSNRGVRLTPAGDALLYQGRHALEAVDAAAESARRSGRTETDLRLAVKPGGNPALLSAILATYADRPDALNIDLVFSGTVGRGNYIRDGRADVALLYIPFDGLAGLAHEPLFTEDLVAILPPTHSLAGRSELLLTDLAHEALPRWTGVPGPQSGPELATIPELIQLIALKRVIGLLPRSLAALALPTLVLVPVSDAPKSTLVVAWAKHDRRQLIASFIAAATETMAAVTGK